MGIQLNQYVVYMYHNFFSLSPIQKLEVFVIGILAVLLGLFLYSFLVIVWDAARAFFTGLHTLCFIVCLIGSIYDMQQNQCLYWVEIMVCLLFLGMLFYTLYLAMETEEDVWDFEFFVSHILEGLGMFLYGTFRICMCCLLIAVPLLFLMSFASDRQSRY